MPGPTVAALLPVAALATAAPRVAAARPRLRAAVRFKKTFLQGDATLLGGAQGGACDRKHARRSVKRGQIQAELGDTLEEFLIDVTPDLKLRQLMMSISEAVRTIAFKVKTASCGAVGCINSFGDEQLAMDVLAEKLLFEALTYSSVCETAVSEEVMEPVSMGGSGFSVAFDPLDGSSIVDTNFTVGTIFGVWPGAGLGEGVTGREQAAAGMGIYGPRTTYCIAMKGVPGTHEFLLQDDGRWVHVKETTRIGEGKMFSPGNLRATFDNPNYQRLVDYYVGEQYTLRYSGGLVPDVFQIIVKERGIFMNVASPSTAAKLQMLFEIAPLAMLIEKAGGATSADGRCISALDVPITTLTQRTQIAMGSVGEIARFEEYMHGESVRFGARTEVPEAVEVVEDEEEVVET